MVSARAQRAGSVSDLELEHRGVVAGVGVDRVELGVGAERHRGEPLDLRGVAPLGGLHDPVEQPVEPLARGHLADVRRRPAGPDGPGAPALGARVRHVGRRRRGRVARPPCTRCRRPAARRAPPATSQAVALATRQAAGPLAARPAAPHRWQKRAWGDSSARQPAQARGIEAGAAGAAEVAARRRLPQAGQAEAGAVMGAEA